MILYFSGTGNSAYVAKVIQKKLNEEIICLNQKIRYQDHSSIFSVNPWVVVTPTYAWQIPNIVQEWLIKTRLEGNKDIYFVMTCGESIGNASHSLQRLCDKKGWNYKGCMPVVMPENYIALFSVPGTKETMQIIENAKPVISSLIKRIQAGKSFDLNQIHFGDSFRSGVIHDLFYYFIVKDKKFYVNKKCVGCKTCQKVCPMNNISLQNKRPVWNHRCTHCMACISQCPFKAIEYGKHTVGKPRYLFPEKTIK